VPSGNQLGMSDHSDGSVRWCTPLPSAFITQICWPSRVDENAIFVHPGENVG